MQYIYIELRVSKFDPQHTLAGPPTVAFSALVRCRILSPFDGQVPSWAHLLLMLGIFSMLVLVIVDDEDEEDDDEDGEDEEEDDDADDDVLVMMMMMMMMVIRKKNIYFMTNI